MNESETAEMVESQPLRLSWTLKCVWVSVWNVKTTRIDSLLPESKFLFTSIWVNLYISSVRIRNGWFFGLTPLKASRIIYLAIITLGDVIISRFGSLRSFKSTAVFIQLNTPFSRAHSRVHSNLLNHLRLKSNSKLQFFKKWDAFWFFGKLFTLQNL